MFGRGSCGIVLYPVVAEESIVAWNRCDICVIILWHDVVHLHFNIREGGNVITCFVFAV